MKGMICGVRVADIREPTMQEVRYLDKLANELARGKTMEKIAANNPLVPAPSAPLRGRRGWMPSQENIFEPEYDGDEACGDAAIPSAAAEDFDQDVTDESKTDSLGN